MSDIENMPYDSLLLRFRDILKHNNLKFTKQREAILQALYDNTEHFSPEDLHLLLKSTHPKLNIGIATVYRTLNLLEDEHMATSISFGAAGKKFELGNKPHHDHMICNACGNITEFEDDQIEKKQELIAREFGFKLTGHVMQLFGVCSTCQDKS